VHSSLTALGWAYACLRLLRQLTTLLRQLATRLPRRHYESFALPETEAYARVRTWRDACVSHPAAQQVTREEIIKLYYDYAKGAGNGALVPGRSVSSFAFVPHWSSRPMPPNDKYGHSATDSELGLI
jgi:glutathione S-transferase